MSICTYVVLGIRGEKKCNLCCCYYSALQPCLTQRPYGPTHRASWSFTLSHSLLKFMSIEFVVSSNHLIFCSPLLLLPSIFPSIWVFSNQSAVCIRLAKVLELQIRPSNECSGLISFRTDWFDLYPWVIMVWPWNFPYPGKISKMVFTYGLSLHSNYYHLNNA